LQEYLQDGFDLAKRKGNQGQALGFLMAIFQKIAASSFAAVRKTLQRRLLMLTIHEAVLRDRDLDIDARERLYTEARDLIHEGYELPHDLIGRGEADRVLAELKLRLVKRLDEEELTLLSDPYGSEYASVHAEELAGAAISLHQLRPASARSHLRPGSAMPKQRARSLPACPSWEEHHPINCRATRISVAMFLRRAIASAE
jgi:hypothetical protein